MRKLLITVLLLLILVIIHLPPRVTLRIQHWLFISPHIERRTPYNIVQLWKIFGFGVKQPQICTLALTLTKNC